MDSPGAPRVVVIGAGVGGVTTAALLARAGLDVTVLEAHVDPGGCAATYFHRGYRFDAGATLAAGFRPGGPFDRLGRRLGIEWRARRVEPAMHVRLGEETVVRWGCAGHWGAERRRVFGPAAERFWRMQEAVADRLWTFADRLPAWPPAVPRDLRGLLRALRPDLLAVLPLLPLSVSGLLRALGTDSPCLRQFVDAQLLISAGATAERVPAVYGLVALDLARQGVYDLPGGIGAIAEHLADSVVRWGGRVRRKRTAASIEVEAGRAVAVRTARGERYPCDYLVANLTQPDLCRLLGPRAALARPPLDLRLPAPEPWGAFVLHLGVAAEAVANAPAAHYQCVVDPGRPLGEGNSVFVSVSPAWDATRAPVGCRAVTISTHTRLEGWWRWRACQEEYEARVRDMTERTLGAAERVLPGLRAGTRLLLAGTPLTFQRYTRRARGAVGGTPQTHLLATRSPRTRLPNAWLVGDSIFPGQSTAAVALGGMRVARDVLSTLSGRAGFYNAGFYNRDEGLARATGG